MVSLLSLLQGAEDGYGNTDCLTGTTTQSLKELSIADASSTTWAHLSSCANERTTNETAGEDDGYVDKEEKLPVPASTDDQGEMVVGHTISPIPKLTGELVIGIKMHIFDAGLAATGSLCL